uniref:F-box domain-containing protein n=1 Tax=Glossina austeni TaxID=7395 RepID=A0A1A9VLP1_GLOAU
MHLQQDNPPLKRKKTKILESTDIMDVSPDTGAVSRIGAANIPNEIWLQVFDNLSHGDLLQITLVCKRWLHLVSRYKLQRGSKLVITKRNLKKICDAIERTQFKCEKVEISNPWSEFRSEVVHIKLHRVSTLTVLSNLLPKLRELDLSDSWPDTRAMVDLKSFSQLTTLLIPEFFTIQNQLLASLTQMPNVRLQQLSIRIESSAGAWLDVLAKHATSLRWLKLGTVWLDAWTSACLKFQHRLREIFRMFTQLEVLDIGTISTRYKKLALENISEKNRLKKIVLSDNSDKSLEIIVQKWSASLEYLDIKRYRESANDAKQLNIMSGKLRCLIMHDANGLADQRLLYSIAPTSNPKLNELKLSHAQLSKESFCVLTQRLPNLVVLDFKELHSSISDEEMLNIFRYLTRLQHLLLKPCVSENGINHLCSEYNISNLKRLKTLRSCFCPIKVLPIISITSFVVLFKRKSARVGVKLQIHAQRNGLHLRKLNAFCIHARLNVPNISVLDHLNNGVDAFYSHHLPRTNESTPVLPFWV